MQIRLKVSRFNPEDSQQAARYSEYSIDVAESATVLDSLLQVRDYEDGTLALRYSCRSAICGSCAMRVNGRVHLACKTKVASVAKGDGRELVVEPMGNMPVIKDLVTDMALYWDKVRQITPWLLPVTQPEREFLVPHTAMRDLSQTMNCIHCGACVSACTVLEIDKGFIGPAALAKAYRFAGDPRDGHTHERLEFLSGVAGGMWDCTRCNMCVEVCPKDVRPMDRIMQLREKAVEANVPGGIGRRHGDAFAGSVRRLGRLDEARFLPASVGYFNVPRLLSEVPGALRLLRVGKLPWSHAMPWHKPIPGIKHVRRLIDSMRREEKEKVSK